MVFHSVSWQEFSFCADPDVEEGVRFRRGLRHGRTTCNIASKFERQLHLVRESLENSLSIFECCAWFGRFKSSLMHVKFLVADLPESSE